MTQIQGEVARLQVMANDLVTELPLSANAARLAEVGIPNVEDLRAIARAEFDESGAVSSASISALSKAMGGGEDAAWGIIFDEAKTDDQKAAAKLVARQFDNIHIMMNAFLTTEGLKCWPPEDPNCP